MPQTLEIVDVPTVARRLYVSTRQLRDFRKMGLPSRAQGHKVAIV